jgi:hypothetical protein
VPCLGWDKGKSYAPNSFANRYFSKTIAFVLTAQVLPPHYDYSERINAFVSCCHNIPGLGNLSSIPGCYNLWNRLTDSYPDVGFNGVPHAEIFNTLVKNIRNEWKKKKLQKKQNARIKEVNDRYKKYCEYVDALFKIRARLVVVRVDLYYEKQYSNQMSIIDLVNDLDHLFRNERCNSLFDDREGYIVKLEYGVDKGVHCHVLLFFNGSERKNSSHVYFAEQIGEYWVNTITKGRGAYWNVNDNADDFDRLGRRGIGVINWSDTRLLKNLKEHVVGYLCKGDQFIKPKFGPKVRLYRRGEFPETPAIKRGRPRKKRQSYAAHTFD